jgi:hypothetical protein
MAGLDLYQQPLIFERVFALRASSCGVVSTGRNIQYTAHQSHRKKGLPRIDKGEPHVDSLAKKTVAFFNI